MGWNGKVGRACSSGGKLPRRRVRLPTPLLPARAVAATAAGMQARGVQCRSAARCLMPIHPPPMAGGGGRWAARSKGHGQAQSHVRSPATNVKKHINEQEEGWRRWQVRRAEDTTREGGGGIACLLLLLPSLSI